MDRFRVGAVKDYPWFQGPGNTNPTFITHEINTRRHAMVENAHGESFLKHGVVPFVSGSPFAVWGKDMSFPLRAITWGTRCRAFYAKVISHCDNPKIKAALKSGLRMVTTLSENTPHYVLEFIMNYHNNSDWQQGASFSFVELLCTCLDIEKKWKAHVDSVGLTIKSVGGSGAYERA